MTLRAALTVLLAAAGFLSSACGNDHAHPPFASDTCAQPPCSAQTTHPQAKPDAGRPVDAGRDSARD